MLSTREPISRAALDQTLARMVFHLNPRPRTILSWLEPCAWTSSMCCIDPLRPPGLSDKCRTRTSNGDNRVFQEFRKFPCAKCITVLPKWTGHNHASVSGLDHAGSCRGGLSACTSLDI